MRPYLDAGAPLAIAHRGFSRHGLENSLAAFQAALDLGFSYLETDLTTTADGVTLAFHDPTLDRTTDQTGVIAQLPYAKVRLARIGGRTPIATLQELLTALPGTHFNLDVKDAASVGPLVELVEKLQLHDRICVTSFSERRRRQVLALLSRPVSSSPGRVLLMAYFLTSPWLPRFLMRALMRSVDVLQTPPSYLGLRLATAKNIDRAHSLGLHVHVWTIDDPAHMHALFDMGVDGIMSDRADLLADVMMQRGYWDGQ